MKYELTTALFVAHKKEGVSRWQVDMSAWFTDIPEGAHLAEDARRFVGDPRITVEFFPESDGSTLNLVFDVSEATFPDAARIVHLLATSLFDLLVEKYSAHGSLEEKK